MPWVATRVWLTAFVLLLTTFAGAGEPSQPEMLPEPRPLPAPAAEPEDISPMVPYPRRNPYEVWLFYGVDRHGVFRPRVVYSPYGPYYLYNGQPYPWAATHSLDFMPSLVMPYLVD